MLLEDEDDQKAVVPHIHFRVDGDWHCSMCEGSCLWMKIVISSKCTNDRQRLWEGLRFCYIAILHYACSNEPLSGQKCNTQ